MIKVHFRIRNTNVYHEQHFGLEVFCQLFNNRCGTRANWQKYCSEIVHSGRWCQNMHASKHSEHCGAHYLYATLCCINTLEHVHWQKCFFCSQLPQPPPLPSLNVYIWFLFLYVVVVIGTLDNYLKGLGRISSGNVQKKLWGICCHFSRGRSVAWLVVTSVMVQQTLITHEDNRCWIIITVMKESAKHWLCPFFNLYSSDGAFCTYVPILLP